MKRFRLWMIAVLVLTCSLIVSAPKEASAEKHLGVTEKQFIVHCNNLLNDYNLRFIKDEQYKEVNKFAAIKWTASYKFYNGLASLLLQESAGQLVNVTLMASSGAKNPGDTPIIKPAVVLFSVVSAVLPSDADFKRFKKQVEDKLLQGLDKFVITVGGKSFDIFNSPLGMVSLAITPAQ